MLAAATHVLVENPIRFSRFLAPRRALSLVGVALVTMTTAGVAIHWQHSAAQAAHALQSGQLLEAVEDANRPNGDCPAVGFLGTDVVECVTGNRTSTFTVVLFGDSHARQWLPAFTEIANSRGWRLVLIRKPACPTARLTIFNTTLNRPYTECDTWREAAIERILSMHPAAVVIANRQLQSFSWGLNGQNDTWRQGSRNTLEALDSKGIKTILLRDTPWPGFDVLDCLSGDTSWWARKRASGSNPCTLDRAMALNGEWFHAEQEAAAGLRNVSILDLSDLFCDGAVCPPTRNGMVVYSDDNHISESFARSLAPELSDRLAKLIPKEGF